MNITDINFAIDILRHPQWGDESDIKKALDIALKSLKAYKEVLEQEQPILDKIRDDIEEYKSRQLSMGIGIKDLEEGKQTALKYVLALFDEYKAESEVEI